MTTATPPISTSNPNRMKFLIGGLLILAAVVYLIASNTVTTANYFFTVDELVERSTVGQDVRISGAVVGETIAYDIDTLELTFEVAHVPGDQSDIDAQGGLAVVLTRAVNDPNAQRLQVHYVGEKPDLLHEESQAIMDGHLGEDGIFYADTLLLKCPTRYEDQLSVDEQASN